MAARLQRMNRIERYPIPTVVRRPSIGHIAEFFADTLTRPDSTRPEGWTLPLGGVPPVAAVLAADLGGGGFPPAAPPIAAPATVTAGL